MFLQKEAFQYKVIQLSQYHILAYTDTLNTALYSTMIKTCLIIHIVGVNVKDAASLTHKTFAWKQDGSEEHQRRSLEGNTQERGPSRCLSYIDANWPGSLQAKSMNKNKSVKLKWDKQLRHKGVKYFRYIIHIVDQMNTMEACLGLITANNILELDCNSISEQDQHIQIKEKDLPKCVSV